MKGKLAGALLVAMTATITTGTAEARPLRCSGRIVTIRGTNAAETIRGTARDDVIAARGGNDRVFGRGGNDIVCAGDGSDSVFGDAGNDVLNGGNGPDLLVGNSGVARLSGEAGNDILAGGFVNLAVNGGPGRDACLARAIGAKIGCEPSSVADEMRPSRDPDTWQGTTTDGFSPLQASLANGTVPYPTSLAPDGFFSRPEDVGRSSAISYNLGRRYLRLVTTVGLQDTTPSQNDGTPRGRFEILADGRVVFRQVIAGFGPRAVARINVARVAVLTLRFTDLRAGIGYTPAFGSPYVAASPLLDFPYREGYTWR